MDKQKVYKIRPHHGMCLAYFEGKGYSQGFVRHMGEVLSLLEEGALVEMTVAGDNICSACPNLKDGVCETADKVETYDRAVLSFCDLKEFTRTTSMGTRTIRLAVHAARLASTVQSLFFIVPPPCCPLLLR